MVQTWWQKLNANERMAATGAIVVFIVALLGTSWLALIGSAVVLVVYWLKYSPNKINWPAPIELINVVISGIIGLFAIVGLLFAFGIGSFGLGILGMGGGFLGGVYILVRRRSDRVRDRCRHDVPRHLAGVPGDAEDGAVRATLGAAVGTAAAPERAGLAPKRATQRLTVLFGAALAARRQLPNGGPGPPGPLCFRRCSRSPTALTPAPETRSPAATSTATWYASVEATLAAALSSGGASAGGGLSASNWRTSGEFGSVPGTTAARVA